MSYKQNSLFFQIAFYALVENVAAYFLIYSAFQNKLNNWLLN
jgi:hypothetical protein